MKNIILKLFLSVVVTVLILGTVTPQETNFGKNKVQYKKFEFYFIQSNHFDVYFTEGGRDIAQYAAEAAELAYKSISRSFGYEITNRIAIIVYNSHNDFQQTNVIYQYMEEGIGGVTELFKNRIVIPFEGDYKKFRHVIHHELVHGVINDMFYGGSLQAIITNNIMIQLPLWFNEGLAEYEALKWDTDSDMFLRDATIHENLPPIEYLGGYFAYRGGQSVWYYIVNKYGEQKISEILSRIKGSRNVEQGFKSAIGLGIEDLNERWQKEMKVTYWPDIAKREEPTEYAQRLTHNKKEGGFYNTSPAISPQGDRIAFISNRDDYFDVFIMNSLDGKIVKKLIKGQRTADFEELHLLTPGMSWSPDGTKIALATKSGAQDAVMIIDVNTGKNNKLEFGLDGIFSVDWSPKGDKLTFIGNTPKQSDVYTYDFNTKELQNLTADIFSDYEPAWSPDGQTIYFTSDRKGYLSPDSYPTNFKMQDYQHDEKDLYKIDIETKLISRIIELPHSEETSPIAAPDGKNILFVSDVNGINNIYVYNIETNTYKPLTNSLTGVYQISMTRDGNKLCFASMINGGFDLFLMRTPLEKNLNLLELEPTDFIKQKQQKPLKLATESTQKDTIKLSDDIIISTVEDSIGLYGKDVKIDLRNYVFSQPKPVNVSDKSDTSLNKTMKENRDEYGEFIVNKYKLNFSPDIVYGNAGFSTYYGIQGSTVMAFSDMLGDHQIIFITNLVGDLKNSDYMLAYYSLPARIDYGIQGFHSARFIVLGDNYVSFLYRFRTYGASVSASYPLTKFYRFDLGLSYFALTRENLDLPSEPVQRRSLILPSVSFVHDNSLWGITSPGNGSRYNLTMYGTPKTSQEGLNFVSVLGDYRTYFKLWKYYSFAFRFAGGASFGANPQRFVIGGVENWLNRQFTNEQVPIENAEDVLFLTSGVPLRGYIYNTRIGTKYFLINNEFRFPFFGYIAAGPLPIFLQTLTGVMFLDLGGSWHHNRDFQAFAKNSEGTYMKDLLGGTGFGARLVLLGFLVKFDAGWWFNLQGFSTPKYYISLGTDF